MEIHPLNSGKAYFYGLDLIRAVAAFLVVFQHARSCFFVDFGADVSPLFKAVYFLNFGHQAVIAFFVLSGCVVGRLILMRAAAGKWSWRDYLFDRLTRLWIVLLPALSLTCVWDFLSLRLSLPSAFPHGGDFAHMFAGGLTKRLGVGVFLGNLAFLQTIAVPTLGSNGPLWSLANEFWYYIAFPLLFLGLVAWRSVLGWMGLLAGIAILWLVGWGIAALFPIWLMGVVAAWTFQKWKPSPRGASLGVAGSLIALTGTLLAIRGGIFPKVSEMAWDYILGAICAVLIHYCLAVQPPRILCRLGSFFSGFSYSLYLLHLPFLTFFAAIFIGRNENRWTMNAWSLGMLFGILLGAYVYAWLVYHVTEARTPALRNALGRWFQRSCR